MKHDDRYEIYPHGKPKQITEPLINTKGEWITGHTRSAVLNQPLSMFSQTSYPILTMKLVDQYGGFFGETVGSAGIISLEDDRKIKKNESGEDPDPALFEELDVDDISPVDCTSCKGGGENLIVSSKLKHITCSVCLGLRRSPIPPSEVFKSVGS